MNSAQLELLREAGRYYALVALDAPGQTRADREEANRHLARVESKLDAGTELDSDDQRFLQQALTALLADTPDPARRQELEEVRAALERPTLADLEAALPVESATPALSLEL